MTPDVPAICGAIDLTADETARFWSKVAVARKTECWEWRGSRNAKGYGQFTVSHDGRSVTHRAHRVAYALHRGGIPDLSLDHLCRNPACCNPHHLEAVTNRENTLRGVSPPAKLIARTHCANGHELTGANLITIRPKVGLPYRRCRACQQDRHRAYVRRVILKKGAHLQVEQQP